MSRRGTGCLIALGLPSAAVAIYTGMAAARLYSIGAPQRLTLIYAVVALVFGISGAGMMLTALGRRTTEPSADPRLISDVANSGTAAFWGFALLWNAVAAPALVFLPEALGAGNRFWLLALVFPLVGAGLLVNAIRLTIRALRFRDSTLLLETAPVGGTLRGQVAVPHPLNGVSAVLIRLTALSRRRSGSETHDTIEAHEERELAPTMLQRIGDLTMIPIEMPIPAGAPPSETNVFWRLVVDAELPGVDYLSTFDVPIERTAFTDFRPHGVPVAIAAPADPKSYTERQTPEGRELYFPPFRAPGRAFLSLLFLVVWMGAIVLTVAIDVPSIITVVMVLIAIPVILNTLALFLESHTVLFGPHDLTLRRRLLTTREHVIATNDIASVQTKGVRPYYRVDLETKSGKRVTMAKNIESKREADWVAARSYKPAKL